MRKDRDAIDYAQLALLAAQTKIQSDIASGVSELRDLEIAKQRKAEMQSRLRQSLIKAEQIVDDMEEDGGVEQYPQNRWVGVQYALNALGKQGIVPPDRFDELADKDRAVRLRKRFQQVAAKARSLMNDEQWRDAQSCWQYMTEEQDLRFLVEARRQAEAQELWKAKISTLEQMGTANKSALKAFPKPMGFAVFTGAFGSIMFLGGVLLAIACVICVLIAVGGFFIMQNKSTEETTTLWRFLIAGVVAGPASALFFWLRSFVWFNLAPQGCQKLELERRRLEQELKAARADYEKFLKEFNLELEHRRFERELEASHGDPDTLLAKIESDEDEDSATDDDPASLVRKVEALNLAKFGGERSADRLHAMYTERRDFVRRIFGESYLAGADLARPSAEDRAEVAQQVAGPVREPLRVPKPVAIAVALLTVTLIGLIAWLKLGVPYMHREARELAREARTLNSADAVPILMKAVKLDAGNAIIWEDLGYAYLEQQNWPAATTAYQRAAALSPETASPHIFLGMIHQRKNELAEAVAEFQQAVTLDPKNTHAHAGLGQTFTLQTNFTAALESYEKALALDSRNAAAWMGIGNVHYQRGRFHQAAGAFENATEIEPKTISTWLGFGNALRVCGEFTNALAAFQKAIKLNQSSSDGWAGFGNTQRKLDQLAEGITALEKAVSLDKENGWVWCALGRAYADQNRWTEAATAFNNFDKSAHFSEPLKQCNRAYLARKQGQMDQALTICMAVTDSEPNLPDGWLELAEVRLAHKDWAEATAAVERAIKLAPEAYDALRLRDSLIQEQAIERASADAQAGRWSDVESALVALGALTNDNRIVTLLQTARNESSFASAISDTRKFTAAKQWTDAGQKVTEALALKPGDATATALKQAVEDGIRAEALLQQAKAARVTTGQSALAQDTAASAWPDAASSNVAAQDTRAVQASFSQLTDLEYELSREGEDGRPGDIAKYIKSQQLGKTVKDLGTVASINTEKRFIQFDAKILGVGPFHGKLAYRIEVSYTGDGGDVVKSLAQNPRSWKHDRTREKTRLWVVGRVKDVSTKQVRASSGGGSDSEKREENLILLEDAKIYREADAQ